MWCIYMFFAWTSYRNNQFDKSDPRLQIFWFSDGKTNIPIYGNVCLALRNKFAHWSSWATTRVMWAITKHGPKYTLEVSQETCSENDTLTRANLNWHVAIRTSQKKTTLFCCQSKRLSPRTRWKYVTCQGAVVLPPSVHVHRSQFDAFVRVSTQNLQGLTQWFHVSFAE